MLAGTSADAGTSIQVHDLVKRLARIRSRPKLQCLVVHQVDPTNQDLIALIKRHSSSLSRVYLHDTKCSKDLSRWITLFKNLSNSLKWLRAFNIEVTKPTELGWIRPVTGQRFRLDAVCLFGEYWPETNFAGLQAHEVLRQLRALKKQGEACVPDSRGVCPRLDRYDH